MLDEVFSPTSVVADIHGVCIILLNSPKKDGLPSGPEKQDAVKHFKYGIPRLMHHHHRHQTGAGDSLEGIQDLLTHGSIQP